MELMASVQADSKGVPSTEDDFGEWVAPSLAAMARLIERLAPGMDRDDVLQNALVRAWVKRDRFNPARGTRAGWLLAIAADQARKARSRTRTWALRDSREAVRSIDDRIDIERAIARLPRRQRLAVDCFYFAGLSVAQTAGVMKCSEGTVRSTLHDARVRLRSIIEVRDGPD
jgi:RNA polymerase sigma factor (sigma-70 family)